MANDLEGFGAIITGGSSGIGLATAATLAADGAHVVLMGRSADRLRDAAEFITNTGVDPASVMTSAGDVADLEAVEAAVELASLAPSGLGIAVAAAGTAGTGSVLSTTAADLQSYLDTNLFGVLHVIRAAGAAMTDSGGAICVVTTNVAHRPPRFAGAYSASKAAAGALVSAAADELGPLGIRVNAVLPGLTETPMVERIFEMGAYVDSLEASTPLGGWSQPQDVAALIRFLVGPEANRLTGEHIVIDGGQSARRSTDFTPAADFLFPNLDPRLLP